MKFWRILALIKKEFIAILMDKGTRMVLIVPVIVQSIIFGYEANFTLERVGYALYDNARGEISTELIAKISNAPQFEQVGRCHDMACLCAQIENGEALIRLYFPREFEREFTLNIIADARNKVSANTAISYIGEIATAPNGAKFGSALDINVRYAYNKNNSTRYTIMVGMILSLSMI